MGTRLEQRIDEYWEWIAVALFLLLAVDLLTTLYAGARLGVEGEANPIMAWLLVQPVTLLIAVHLGAAFLAVACFYALMEMLRQAPPGVRPYFAFAVELWLGFLLTAGLLVFANNTAVIILGRSLL